MLTAEAMVANAARIRQQHQPVDRRELPRITRWFHAFAYHATPTGGLEPFCKSCGPDHAYPCQAVAVADYIVGH